MSEAWLQWASLGFRHGFFAYILFAFWQHSPLRGPIYNVSVSRGMPYLAYSQYQHSQRFFMGKHDPGQLACAQTQRMNFSSYWPVRQPNQAVVIDVYARLVCGLSAD